MADNILRSWACLNGNCVTVFDAWEAAPACPQCGCVRVSWVPGGGHIGKAAGAVDAEFRALADCFGMTDMASGGARAMPKVAQPAVDPNGAPMKNFGNGFACVPHPERAVCVPSAIPVTSKVKIETGNRLARSRSDPGIAWNTRVEARHADKP